MLLKPLSILWFISSKRIVSGQISGCLWKTKKMFQIVTLWISDLNETEKKKKKSCYWADLQRLFTGLKRLFARAVTTVISSISPPLHFQTFPLVKLAALCYCGPTEHVPILLRAIALRDSTCSESTLLNALRQDYIFFYLFVYLLYFHDFVMLLGSYSF